MAGDRIFGLIMAVAAFAYVASASQIPVSFLSDPVGPKGFPMLVGGVGGLAALVIALRPDPSPDWPGMRTLWALLITVIAMVAYAFVLKPFGFLLPTVCVAAIVSYQISPDVKRAAASGVGISIILFLIFRYLLGLGLMPLPRSWMAIVGG
jgi:putative tricarboxylic transport membrane protein